MLPVPSELFDFFEYRPDTGRIHRTKIPASGSRHFVGQAVDHLNGHGYPTVYFRGHRYLTHRIAWKAMTGQEPDRDVDHINMVRNDNRWVNLRLASRAENMWNTKARTPFGKGVHFHRRTKKFVAQIRIGGKQTHLGLFSTPEEAQAVYWAAALKHHGEFARVG